MKPGYAFTDWGQTLIQEDGDTLLKCIGKDEIKHSIKGLDLPRIYKLVCTKRTLKKMMAQYRAEPECNASILKEVANLYVDCLKGAPIERIWDSVRNYAAEAIDRLDPAFYEVCHASDDGLDVTILTRSFEGGIKGIVAKLGKGGNLRIDGSTIAGNSTVEDVVIRNQDKAMSLENSMKIRKMDPKQSVYMGDRKDESCIEVAGIFVVPPMETDQFRQYMSSKYGTKVRTPSNRKGEVYRALTMD